MLAPPTTTEAVHHGALRVLVADDHPVNQFLARELIEMRGHVACIVPDGQAAVDRWSTESFDVILMDLQMPRMNGIEAARRIRELESGTGKSTPIVALTANSGTAEQQSCLEAGINAFLSKPLDPDLLFPLVAKLTGKRDTPTPVGSPTAHEAPCCPVPAAALSTPVPAGILDRDAALRLARGNAKVLVRLAELFRQQTPAIIEGIDHAIDRRSSKDLSFHAHRLKGSLSFLALAPLESAALKLEQRGKDGCWEDVPETWNHLRTDLSILDRELELLKA